MTRRKTSKPAGRAEPRDGSVSNSSFPIVGIGASAGGLEAIGELLKSLDDRIGMGYVVVQHLDPTHESMLTSLLQRQTRLQVSEVKSGMKVVPDRVYVIPPNVGMNIDRGVLKLTPRAAEKKHMPIDHFLSSLAADCKSRAVGIILSGTAADGVVGLEAIKAQGGITFAQDEKSAKYPEMPKNAVAAGCVDLVLPPKGIARELARIGRHPYVTDDPASAALRASPADESEHFAKVFNLLSKATQADFSLYKRATVRRRIARRLALHRLPSLKEYVKFLQENPQEIEALYYDILIKVTGFFRDPGAFEVLKSKVFPALSKGRARNVPIRIWVPGCSTGEEAYSIAISLIEFMNGLQATVPTQIFATDLSESAVEKARTGIYPDSIAADVSPQRLRRFFSKVEGGYQISKMIRDMCVVARQNLVKDPPFSKIDLVSCRNVLIYLEPVLHRKIFPLFHYALKPGGYLMLGSSETVGTYSNLFSVADRKHKVFSRRQVLVPTHFDLPPMPAPDLVAPTPEEPRRAPLPARETETQREVDRLILSKYTPAGVVVDPDFEILQFRGHTDRYLQPAPGKASLNLLKMVREGLLFELRATLQRARRGKTAVRSAPVHMGDSRDVRIEIIPLTGVGDSPEGQYLVLFAEGTAESPEVEAAGRKAPHRSGMEVQRDQIRQELAATKDHLQSIIEEQETTNEELKSANEEILSSNEELQSTNEELETAKEELQSTNEELTTLNEELHVRNSELTQVNNDISNLLASVNIPIVMLGSDLRIRRFPPQSEKLLNLIPSDVGRPITDLKPNIEVPDLEKMIEESIESVSVQEREVRDAKGRWYSVRVRPYRTRDNKIDGAVLVFVDIDALKRISEDLTRSRDYAESLFEAVREAVFLLDSDLRIRRVSPAFYSMFRLPREEVEGKFYYELGGDGWGASELREKLHRVLSDGDGVRDFEVVLDLPRLGAAGPRKYLLNARKVIREQESGPMVLVTVAATQDLK